MAAMTVDILVIILLIVCHALFVLSEIAIVSARKTRLQQWASNGNTRARKALELATTPTRFLLTMQIGITLVGILAGAFGGVTVAQEFAAWLGQISVIAPYREPLSLGLVVVGITFLTLVVGELVPKQLALLNAERLVLFVAGPARVLSAIFSLAVRFLSFFTDLVLTLLRARPSTEPSITEEEINTLLTQGTQAGTFEETERDMVARVFRLHDQRVNMLMTPRKDIIWLEINDSLEEIRRKTAEHPYARFPVGDDSLDNTLGIIQAKDLLIASLAGQPLDLKASLRPAPFIPESIPASKVLELFKRTHLPMALVVDEYGIITGVVTLNDVLAALVGNLPEIGEFSDPQAWQREDGSWLLDGMLPVEKLKEIFHLEKLPGEERGYYQTLGGFLMMYMEHIPAAGQYFEWGGFRFEVVDMDLQRVDKVLVAPVRNTKG
ncbi:MAG: hemolysin family protein [Candidatus Binatia bacterium]